MSELFTPTVKYFRYAIAEFLPLITKLRDDASTPNVKQELEDLVEMYTDIATEIDRYNLNLEDPNRFYLGEPDEISLRLTNPVIINLVQLTLRLAGIWGAKIKRLSEKPYATDKNREEIRRLVRLMEPLQAYFEAPDRVLYKYKDRGALVFPGENKHTSLKSDDLSKKINIVLDEEKRSYAAKGRSSGKLGSMNIGLQSMPNNGWTNQGEIPQLLFDRSDTSVISSPNADILLKLYSTLGVDSKKDFEKYLISQIKKESDYSSIAYFIFFVLYRLDTGLEALKNAKQHLAGDAVHGYSKFCILRGKTTIPCIKAAHMGLN